jgi:putative ABC transport system permease protein
LQKECLLKKIKIGNNNVKKDYFVLAVKSLKHRGIRSWLTLMGIFIGVVAVVSLIGLGEGLKSAVNAQFGITSVEVISIEAGGISMGAPGSGASKALTIKELDAVKKVNNVEIVIRRNINSLLINFNDKTIVGIGTNVPSEEGRDFAYEAIEAEVIAGRLLEDGDKNKVILGYNFYVDKNGLGKEIYPGDKLEIQGKTFKVIGILEKKGSFIYDNIILMNEEDMQELLNYGNKVDLIAVKVKDKNLMNKTIEDLEKVLREERDVKKGKEDFTVSTPQAALATIDSILGGVQIFIVIIAMISVFVGAVGIVNTMTTSVMERKKEIGVMKAIGARNIQIFFQFLIESGLLGMTGGIVGILIGTIIGFYGTIAIGEYIGSEITASINWILIVLTLFGSFLIGAVSGIAPAMRAAKQNPVEALKG